MLAFKIVGEHFEETYVPVSVSNVEAYNISNESIHFDVAAGTVTILGGEEPAPASGQCGDNLTWSVEDGVLTISGTGDMYSYDSWDTAPWYSFRGEIRSVKIADGVTSIGNYAFYDCTKLESVSIAGSVSSIGEYAFENCTGLTAVSMPDSVQSIGNSAFYNCESLVGFTLPTGLTRLGRYSLAGCSSLKHAAVPAGVTAVEYGTFAGCGALQDVMIPTAVKSIQGSAFHECESLETVYYGGSESDWAAVPVGRQNEPLLAAALVAAVAEPPVVFTDDVNRDGDVDTVDASLLLQPQEEGGAAPPREDVFEAVKILQYLVGD